MTQAASAPMTSPAVNTTNTAQQIETAISHHRAGRFQEAAQIYRSVLQHHPRQADALHLLGLVSDQLGNSQEAVELIEKAIQNNSSQPTFYNNLGTIYHKLNRLDDAKRVLQRAVSLHPDYAEANNNLGNVQQDQNESDQALASYRKALAINPGYAKAHNNLGNLLKKQGQLSESIASIRTALRFDSRLAEAHVNLGNALAARAEQGDNEEVLNCYRTALELKPNYAEAYYNLGNALLDQNKLADAITAYRQALAVKPDYLKAYINLGNSLKEQGHLEMALSAYHDALAIKSDYVDALNNIGKLLTEQGRLQEATAYYRSVLNSQPTYSDTHSNLIFAMDLDSNISIREQQKERRQWNELHALPLIRHQKIHANTPDPQRRLRIGYLSADFRRHSAFHAFSPMLLYFDPAQFEVIAYSNHKQEDDYTDLLKAKVSAWRNISSKSDEETADLIRKDKIDILVDLSGHSGQNRLLVMARKPAPLQVTGWGYASSTGLQAIDVFFTDTVFVPPEEKDLYTEQVRYLPNGLTYFSPVPFPAVNVLPALTAPGITFGSFNRLAKISEPVLDAWVQIFSALPQSRLLMKAPELDHASNRDRIAQHFQQSGIDSTRITMLGKTSWDQHMATFCQVDIALDAFPHGGGITTLDSMAMGVPVVTLRWPTIAGRVGASILTTLGLTEWIAENSQQYVAIAIQKSLELDALAQLRQQLRSIFTSSAIGDVKSYVRAVEREYRDLWTAWCAHAANRASNH